MSVIGMVKARTDKPGLTSISSEKIMVPFLYETQPVPVHEESASVSGRLIKPVSSLNTAYLQQC